MATNKKADKCPPGTVKSPVTDECVPCPGSKVRSGGEGQGKGFGGGKGPLGVPVGNKTKSSPGFWNGVL